MESKFVKLIDEDGKEITLPIDNTSVNINKSIRYEDNTGEGNSSLSRLYQGYDPATIEINFQLSDDEKKTAIEKLKYIEKTFKRLKNGRPVIWTIIDYHCKARGIKKVQYESLQSSETETGINAVLTLIEAENPEAKKEKKTGSKTEENTNSKKEKSKTSTCTIQSTSEYCRQLLVKYEKEKMDGKTILSFNQWVKQKPLPPSADTETA